MNETPKSRLVRKKQLAAILGVPHRTLDRWVQNRLIPYIAPTRRLYLFDPEQVLEVLTERHAFTPGGDTARRAEKEPAASDEAAGSHAIHLKVGTLHSEVRE